MARSGIGHDPMVYLLLGTSGLYWLLGEPLDAMFLTIAVGVLFLITALQERRAERALDALKKLSQPRVRVVREGRILTLPAEQLCLGDHLILQEGDRVTGDGVLLEATSMTVDESLLTGESVPAWAEAGRRLHAGTSITHGRGLLKVEAIGPDTRAGKIGLEILEELKHPLKPTPSQLALQKLSRRVGFGAIILSGLIFGILQWRGEKFTQALLLSLAAGVSLIPVEFSLVSLITLALGAERLTKKNILVRHARAIEALGAINILALDKTGTLTENRLRLQEVVAFRRHPKSSTTRVHSWKSLRGTSPHGAIRKVLESAELASHREPFDPLELAIQEAVHHSCPEIREPHRERVLLKEYPIETRLRAMTCVWLEPTGLVLATKGAPEAIFDLCHLNPSSSEWDLLQSRLHHLTDEGYRVLGVAKGTGRHEKHGEFTGQPLPRNAHDFTFEFLGLLALEDPIRPTVPETVRLCGQLGISLVMLTGDHPRTALAIGRKAGFSLSPPKGLGQNILARVSPEEKLQWVRRKMEEGHRVAMTGDGVNDAPSLSAAHVGIAMGSRATEVAREASSIILMDDRFESLVTGIQEGRRISHNLSDAAQFILAVHALVGVLAIGPPILGWLPLFRPAEIVFIEFVMDPSAALIFPSLPLPLTLEPSPTREDSLLPHWRRSVLQGLTLGGITLCTYAWNLSFAFSEKGRLGARASTFESTLLAIAFLVFLSMPGKLGQNATAKLILLGALLLVFILIPTVPVLRSVLDWSDPSAGMHARSLGPLTLGFWALNQLRRS